MKISFIIPVYNVEEYLSQCIESIINQTYKDIEIILVDDGSPDNSKFICDKYASEDQRIKVVHKANGGAASARNRGTELATGEYIIYVDGDDFWIKTTYLQELVDFIQKNPDLDFVGFNCSYYFSHNNLYKKWVNYKPAIIDESNKDKLCIELVRCGVFPMSPCLKIIKKETLISKKIIFPEGITGEDIPWFIDLLDKSDKYKFINLYIYAYRRDRTESVTRNFTIKSFDNFMYILDSELKKIPKREFSSTAKNALMSFLAYEFCFLLSQIRNMPKNVQKEKRVQLLSYKWLLDYTENPKVKLVYNVNKFLGITLTEKLLNYFEKLK